MSWDTKDRIKAGDKVDVLYINDCVIENATMIRTPQGAGDLWQIKQADGTVRAINPYNIEFCEFIKYLPEVD